MAYIQDGYVVIQAGPRKLVIDEFDEDAINITEVAPKSTSRNTTKGRPMFNIKPLVAYNAEMAIPPLADVQKAILDFQDYLLQNKYPNLEFFIYEYLDGVTKKSTYKYGNWMKDLNFESIMGTDAPTGSIQLQGTLVDVEFS